MRHEKAATYESDNEQVSLKGLLLLNQPSWIVNKKQLQKSLARSSHMGMIIDGKQVFEGWRSNRCSEHIKTQIQLQNIAAVIEKQEDGSDCEHFCQQPLTWHTGRPAQPVRQPPVCDIIRIWYPCLWRNFIAKLFMPKTSVRKQLKKKRLDCIASLFLWEKKQKQNKHLFDEVVLLVYRKLPAGVTWDEVSSAWGATGKYSVTWASVPPAQWPWEEGHACGNRAQFPVCSSSD